MLEWWPLQYQRLKELSGKLSKPCLSHWHLVCPDGARWTEHMVPKISAGPSKGNFPARGEVHCAYTAEMAAMGEEEGGPWQGVGEQPV